MEFLSSGIPWFVCDREDADPLDCSPTQLLFGFRWVKEPPIRGEAQGEENQGMKWGGWQEGSDIPSTFRCFSLGVRGTLENKAWIGWIVPAKFLLLRFHVKSAEEAHATGEEDGKYKTHLPGCYPRWTGIASLGFRSNNVKGRSHDALK